MKNLQRTPRERGSEEVAATPADKEELRQRLENSGEDWGTPRKTGELRGRLGNSAEDWGTPRKTAKLRGSLGSSRDKELQGRALRRQREEGTTVGRLGEL